MDHLGGHGGEPLGRLARVDVGVDTMARSCRSMASSLGPRPSSSSSTRRISSNWSATPALSRGRAGVA